MRTGDLGFFHNKELFICGRLKDLIIVRGSNHYPQDIERTAEKAAQTYLRPGCSAAFGVTAQTKETEKVVYVAEVKDMHLPSIPFCHVLCFCPLPQVKESVTSLEDFKAAVEAARSAVAMTHGLAITVICLLRTRTIPKTTSGKIARAWCRKGFLAGTLEIVYRWESSNEPTDDENLASAVAAEADDVPEAGDAAAEAGGGAEADNVTASPPSAISAAAAAVHASLTPEEVRAMPMADLLVAVERALAEIAGAALPASIDKNASLVAMGLDSMTLVQFKGVIEKRCCCLVCITASICESCSLTLSPQIWLRCS